MRRHSALGTALLLLGTACSSPHAETGPGDLLSPAVRREALGRSIALGMSSPAIRAELLDAMRASPLVDHKIALDEWITSADGFRFIRAVADRSGVDEDSLGALVQGLAPVDLYFPRRSDRSSWTGAVTPVVLVEPGIHQSVLRLYDTEGVASEAERNGAPFPEPMLMLQASEGRDRRIGPLVLSAASIQDPTEPGLGGAITLRRRDGTIAEVQLADLAAHGSFMQQCPPDLEDSCGGGGGGGGSIVGGGGVTYLNGLSVNGVDDNGVPGQSNEFEFRAKAYIGLDVIAEGTLRLTGVDPDYGNTNMHLPMIANAPDNYAYLEVDVVETDGWPNPDDNFDYVTYQPNRVFFRIPLYQADQGRWWPLKEQPYIGVFDPEKVLPQFTWVNN